MKTIPSNKTIGTNNCEMSPHQNHQLYSTSTNLYFFFILFYNHYLPQEYSDHHSTKDEKIIID